MLELAWRFGAGTACSLQPVPRVTAWQRLVFGSSAVLLLAAAPAAAQGVGFQGGGTVSPNQFYVGSHLEVPLGSPQFLLRPGIEGGAGDGVTLASINFEFLYLYELPSTNWAIYQGTGPAVNFARIGDSTSVRGGFNLVFGVRHETGFFSELKIGGSGSPNLRYGIGFTINTGRSDP